MPGTANATVGRSSVWTLDDVAYDPATHTSKLPGGQDVPHVTGVLRALGISEGFAHVDPRVIAQAGARGTAVHADCHAYDDDDLDWDVVDDRVRPYVEAWATFRLHKQLVPESRERRLYHPTYNYTGIMDGIFTGGVQVDIKTGNPENSAGHLQTAAYACAYNYKLHVPRRCSGRLAVWLRPERRVPYTIYDYGKRPDGRLDESTWFACLTAYAQQAVRRPATRFV